MTNFVISYDLISPGQSYKSVTDKIKTYGSPCKVLESLWYVKSPKTAEQIKDELSAYADTNDKIFVVQMGEIRPRWAGQKLGKMVTDHLLANV